MQRNKTSPARLAQLLQHSLALCFSLQPIGRYAVIGCKLKQNANEGCNSCATVQELFYVLLRALFYLRSLHKPAGEGLIIGLGVYKRACISLYISAAVAKARSERSSRSDPTISD